MFINTLIDFSLIIITPSIKSFFRNNQILIKFNQI